MSCCRVDRQQPALTELAVAQEEHVALQIDVDGRSFRARVKNEILELAPAVELAAWGDLLLTKLSDAAAGDHDLRRAVLRSGWALR